MWVIVYKTIVTFLVIYALVELFSKLMKCIFTPCGEKREIFVFIHVKNQEISIEYIIRMAIFNYLCTYGGRMVPYIVIVDKGSDDSTAEISKKLCDKYEFLYYTTEDEYLEFKKQTGR